MNPRWRIDGSRIDRLSLAAYAAYVGLIASYAWLKPHYNWDMIAYIGCAYEYQEADVSKLHAKTFETVRAAVPAQRYEALTSGRYFGDVARDPESFHQQLPISRVKLFYVFLLYLLVSVGLPPVASTVMISVSCAIVIASISLRWLLLHYRPAIAAPLAALVLNASSLLIMAQISTADALSSIPVLLGLYQIMERGRIDIGLAFVTASVLVRYDNIILAEILAAYLLVRERTYGRRVAFKYAAIMVGLAILYLAVARFTDAYSWTTLFVHSFAGQLNRPAEYTGGLPAVVYVSAVLRGCRDFLAPQPAFVMLAGFLAVVQTRHSLPEDTLRRDMILLVFAVILTRFLLFPYVMGRHFFPFYVTIGLTLATTNRALRDSGWSPSTGIRTEALE